MEAIGIAGVKAVVDGLPPCASAPRAARQKTGREMRDPRARLRELESERVKGRRHYILWEVRPRSLSPPSMIVLGYISIMS